MKKPDTIAVNVELERKVHASGVDMHVEIRGDSLISGQTALKKAREVRDLVTALADVGIPADKVQVVGIRAEVSSGLIGKSSSAVYRLRVGIASPDTLADALGAVTSRKNATLIGLEWQYDRLDELHSEMLTDALRKAQTRAALICRELGHRSMGVHALTENLRDHHEKQGHLYRGGTLSEASLGVRRKVAVTKDDLGLEVSHTKTVSLDLRVEYRVEPEPEGEQGHAADG